MTVRLESICMEDVVERLTFLTINKYFYIYNMKIKTVIMGDRTTGKTHLLSYLDKRLKTERYVPTIGVDFVSYNKSGTVLHIWDTSGSDRFSNVVRTFIRGASLILIVYNSERSFKKIPMYLDTIKNVTTRDYHAIIVNLGTDIAYEAEGQLLASQEKIPFYSCNVHNRADVLTFWHELMHFCEEEVATRGWEVDLDKPSTEIITIPPIRSSYRLCFWW